MIQEKIKSYNQLKKKLVKLIKSTDSETLTEENIRVGFEEAMAAIHFDEEIRD